MKKLVVGCLVFLFVSLAWGKQQLRRTGSSAAGGTAHCGYRPPELGVDYVECLRAPRRARQGWATGADDWPPRWRWLDDRTLEMTLRQGVTFHNGEVFDADIVKLNWEENTRLRQPHRSGDVYELHAGVAPGDHRSADGPVYVSGTGRWRLAKLSPMHLGNRQFYREFGWGEKSW